MSASPSYHTFRTETHVPVYKQGTVVEYGYRPYVINEDLPTISVCSAEGKSWVEITVGETTVFLWAEDLRKAIQYATGE